MSCGLDPAKVPPTCAVCLPDGEGFLQRVPPLCLGPVPWRPVLTVPQARHNSRDSPDFFPCVPPPDLDSIMERCANREEESIPRKLYAVADLLIVHETSPLRSNPHLAAPKRAMACNDSRGIELLPAPVTLRKRAQRGFAQNRSTIPAEYRKPLVGDTGSTLLLLAGMLCLS